MRRASLSHNTPHICRQIVYAREDVVAAFDQDFHRIINRAHSFPCVHSLPSFVCFCHQYSGKNEWMQTSAFKRSFEYLQFFLGNAVPEQIVRNAVAAFFEIHPANAVHFLGLNNDFPLRQITPQDKHP